MLCWRYVDTSKLQKHRIIIGYSYLDIIFVSSLFVHATPRIAWSSKFFNGKFLVNLHYHLLQILIPPFMLAGNIECTLLVNRETSKQVYEPTLVIKILRDHNPIRRLMVKSLLRWPQENLTSAILITVSLSNNFTPMLITKDMYLGTIQLFCLLGLKYSKHFTKTSLTVHMYTPH